VHLAPRAGHVAQVRLVVVRLQLDGEVEDDEFLGKRFSQVSALAHLLKIKSLKTTFENVNLGEAFLVFAQVVLAAAAFLKSQCPAMFTL
jgi:hypothetical protein